MKKIIIWFASIVVLFIVVYIIDKLVLNEKHEETENIFKISRISKILLNNEFSHEVPYFNLNQYKELELGDLINRITFKLPLINKLTSYPDKIALKSGYFSMPKRNYIRYVFYLDSTYNLIFNVYLPMRLESNIFKIINEGKDIFKYVEKQKVYFIIQLKFNYKKYIKLHLINSMPEKVLPGPEQDSVFRKIDSLKAVLKR